MSKLLTFALVASFFAFQFAFKVEATEPPTRQVEFENDLIPLFTKLGCNAGACHGAAIGRGGFKLSLYGGDPKADYDAIAHHLEGRRINQSKPERSLLLLKPTEELAHGGGYLIEDGDESGELLLNWIRQGAQPAGSRKLQNVEVHPKSIVVPNLEEPFELSATAHYSDGSSRDVTRWTVFTPEDSSAVSIEDGQFASAHRKGRHIIVARFLTEVIPVEILVPVNESYESSTIAEASFIDREVDERLGTLGLPKSAPSDDLSFLRRVSLDLTGRLPSQKQIEAAVQGIDRSELINELLESDEFNEYWTWQIAKLFRMRGPNGGQTEGLNAYHSWLAKQLADDAAYDEMVKQLVHAAGAKDEYGPANFYGTVSGPREQAELFSELFMGSRMRCANCHNHPLDRWTQDDYHGLAAIFARVDMGGVVKVKPSGAVIHPKTLENASLRIPGDYTLDKDIQDGREELTKWLTHSKNPYFAKAIVNRLWKYMMGRGLVEPVDDFRDTNPATHPELLEMLAEDFVENGYQLKSTLKLIASSEAYARSANATPKNKDDDKFYSHAIREALEPEVLADAIADVLGVSEKYGAWEIGTRAIELSNPKTPSRTLDVLGRCGRETSCESADTVSGGLPQKLHLFNGPLLNARIRAPESRLSKLLKDDTPPTEIVTKFYQHALGRKPTGEESTFWSQALDAVPKSEQPLLLEDFVWSLLTCEEFAHKN